MGTINKKTYQRWTKAQLIKELQSLVEVNKQLKKAAREHLHSEGITVHFDVLGLSRDDCYEELHSFLDDAAAARPDDVPWEYYYSD